MAQQAVNFTMQNPNLYSKKVIAYCKDKLINDQQFRDKYFALIKKDLLDGNMPLGIDYLNDIMDTDKVNSLVENSYKKSRPKLK